MSVYFVDTYVVARGTIGVWVALEMVEAAEVPPDVMLLTSGTVGAGAVIAAMVVWRVCMWCKERNAHQQHYRPKVLDLFASTA